MAVSQLVSLAGTAALVAIASIAALSDWRTRRLPNWLSLVALICGLAWSGLVHGPSGLGSALAHAALAFAVGAALFTIDWFGGGDAKFYAAMAAWFPIESGFQLLLAVTLCGGLLSVAWMFNLGRSKSNEGHDRRRDLPYGLAIAIGSIIAFVLQ